MCRHSAESSEGQHRPPPELERARTCICQRIKLIVVFDAASFVCRSPDPQSSPGLGNFFVSRAEIFELSQSVRSRITLCIIRPVRQQSAGLHVPLERLQVSVEVVPIKEHLVFVVE